MGYREFEIITAEPFNDSDIALFARQRPDNIEELDDPKLESKRVRIDIVDFEPYFFIHKSDVDRAYRMMEEGFETDNGVRITKILEGFQSIGYEPLVKVVINKPQPRKIREKFKSPSHIDIETWESDINNTMRFRIDAGIKSVFRIPECMLKKVSENRYETSWTTIEPLHETKEPVIKPKNFYFDIEVGGRNQALPEDDDLNPIACITAYDSHTEELVSWVWRTDFRDEIVDDVWYHEDIGEFVTWEIRKYDNEMKLLADFFQYFKDGNFDILSGWYSDKYDVPYVINRAEELGLDPNVWSEMGRVKDGLPVDSWGQAKIAGTFMNDLERRYDNIVSPTSSALEQVASTEENIMSWPQESSNIQDIWEQDVDKLLEYNANDVIATAKVDEKAGITDFFLEKQYMTGCRVEEIEKDSNVITYYLMHEATKDEIIPRAKVRTHKDFGGGRVIMPDLSGIVSPVAVLDLSKIYPSIMITMGLSYENAKGVDPIMMNESLTIEDEIPDVNLQNDELFRVVQINEDGRDKIVWEIGEGDVISPLALGKKGRKVIWDNLYEMKADGTLEKTKDWRFLDPDEQIAIEDKLPSDHVIDKAHEGERLPNGVRINVDKNGLVTRSLDKMFDIRYKYGDARAELDQSDENYKEEYDRLTKKRQNAKDQINAVFGYSGYKKSPLFKPEIAMTTTFIGRNILKMCEKVTEELGHRVIYGDTDSIMVLLEGDEYDYVEDPKGCIEEGKRVGQTVNARMDDFAENFCGVGRDEHMFSLEFEKMYQRMFLGDKKKRYAGLKVWDEDGGYLDNPYVDITGFEYVRNDSSELTGMIQKAIFDSVLMNPFENEKDAWKHTEKEYPKFTEKSREIIVKALMTEPDKDKVLDIIQSVQTEVENGEYPVLIACRGPSVKAVVNLYDKYKQPPIAARAGQFTHKFFDDVNIQEGDDVFYVYIRSTGYNHNGRKLPEDTHVLGMVEGMNPPQAKISCKECDYEWTEDEFGKRIQLNSKCPECGHSYEDTVGEDDPFDIDGCFVDWTKIADKSVKNKSKKVLKHLNWEDALDNMGDQDTFSMFS